MVPLKHIFGFCDDYNKVVYGFKHTLTLVRKADDDAIFTANGADTGKVNLHKIIVHATRTTFRHGKTATVQDHRIQGDCPSGLSSMTM